MPLSSEGRDDPEWQERFTNTMLNGLLASVTPMITEVVPNQIAQGQSIKITLLAPKAKFTADSQIEFNHSDIKINEKRLLSETQLEANVTVNASTPLDFYDITVITGEQRIQGYGILQVVTPSIKATISSVSPAKVPRNNEVHVQIDGENTHFNQNTTIQFGTENLKGEFTVNPHISVSYLKVLSPNSLQAILKIGEQSWLGYHNIRVTTSDEVVRSRQISLFQIVAEGSMDVPPPIIPPIIPPGDPENPLPPEPLPEPLPVSPTITIILDGQKTPQIGQTISLKLALEHAQFDEQSKIYFTPDQDIQIVSKKHVNDHLIELTLAIGETATVGNYTITVETQGKTVVLKDGFTVTAAGTPSEPGIDPPSEEPPVKEEPVTPVIPEPPTPILPDDPPPITPPPPPPENHSLSIIIDGQGSVSLTDIAGINNCAQELCQFDYPENTAITLLPQSGSDSEFKQFSDNCLQGQVLLQQDTVCRVTFKAIEKSQELPICPETGLIRTSCQANNQPIYDITIEKGVTVSRAILNGFIDNKGWIIHSKIAEMTEVNQGYLSGTITNLGTIRDSYFVGLYLFGGELAGTVINNSKLPSSAFIDVKLAANAVIKGGRLSGYVIGKKNQPARLESLLISNNAYLENVIITKSVKLGDNVTIGEGVLFEPDVVIEKSVVFANEVMPLNYANIDSLPKNTELSPLVNETFTFPCALDRQLNYQQVDLNRRLITTAPTLLESLNQISELKQNHWQLQQENDGSIYFNDGSSRWLLNIYSLRVNREQSNRAFFSREHVEFITPEGLHFKARRYFAAPCTLQQIVTEAEVATELNFNDSGLIQIDLTNGTWLQAQVDWTIKPAPKGQNEGLYVTYSPYVSGLPVAHLIYPDQDNKLWMQLLSPTLADSSLFYAQIGQAITMDELGFIRFSFNGQLYQGVLDYSIKSSRPISQLRIDTINDVNLDGKADFLIYYPNGMQQVLFGR
ncbi:hypothetical protein TPSD3_08810 [Thioflexithrix psekupsensis]|uniref:Uncharacterized protein n=1 Tax=Thioflexithrix psekupsensis TaxID=1570016 RepID=A0A251X8Z2_9GAMM|nr:hypothetical protein TPSD3_08810 [Thioflexithrix psekupsensis]